MRQDSHGTYHVPDTWIDAWPGGGGHVAGWCLCEVREYHDGTRRTYCRPAIYVHDAPEMAALHSIYLLAQQALSTIAAKRGEEDHD